MGADVTVLEMLRSLRRLSSRKRGGGSACNDGGASLGGGGDVDDLMSARRARMEVGEVRAVER